MRAYPFQIIVVAALGALVPAAYAASRPSHATRPSAHAAAAKPAKAMDAAGKGKSAKTGHQKPAKVEIAETRVKHGKHVVLAKAELPIKHGKHRHDEEEEAAPVRTKLVRGHRGVLAAAPAPKLVAKVQRAAPIAEPEPEPALDPIHVTHDRKQHFSSEPVPGDTQQEGDGPRKATAADFMSVDAPTTPTPELPSPAQKPAGAAIKLATKSATVIRTSPTAGVVVGSRVEVKPVALPILQIAPEPLVALYDKRGRLIVPPAMKGSHEVLIHQNVMADSDGLERIQDDEDLLRMRASKLLVALPENDGIQTDDRLPMNRRYCRPWTAAFLTALARAHYARFHSALQVNSAVRTVEFQQRLMRTNGNAAPAEGETASPHLTGQAVDIAKHGLSMTEIAWMRGYLLPLMQEGKLDVEEEFQQACFHISVYKKYLPQPAPHRLIAATKHGSGATLAVAMP